MPDLEVRIGEKWVVDGGIKNEKGEIIPCEPTDLGALIGVEQVNGAALSPQDWAWAPLPTLGLPTRSWEVVFLRETPKEAPSTAFPAGRPIPHAIHCRFQNPDNDGRLNSIDQGELIVTVLPALQEQPPPPRILKAIFPLNPPMKG